MTTDTLRNAYSTSKNTFSAIQKTLTSHKARQVTFDYYPDGSGKIEALTFTVVVSGRDLPFRLPARVQHVEKILYQGKRTLTDAMREQAYRTAWACIRDWLDSQMALIDIGAVSLEEVFLPYLLNRSGQTLYEVMQEQQFLLPSGERNDQ